MSITYKFFLFHTFHENDKQLMGLISTVVKGFLNGHKELVPQRLTDDAEITFKKKSVF